MKRTALATTVVSGLVVSLVFGAHFMQLVQANGYIIHKTYNGSPIITIESPLNDKVVSFNTAVVAFTLTRPSSKWISESGTSCAVTGVKIIVDGAVYRSVAVNSELRVPFSYSLNVTDLQNGAHSLQLNGNCRGVSTTIVYPAIQNEHYLYYEALSDTVSFTVDAPEPSPEPTSTPTPTTTPEAAIQSATFPATLFFVSSVGIALGVGGLLIYFRKRNTEEKKFF